MNIQSRVLFFRLIFFVAGSATCFLGKVLIDYSLKENLVLLIPAIIIAAGGIWFIYRALSAKESEIKNLGKMQIDKIRSGKIPDTSHSILKTEYKFKSALFAKSLLLFLGLAALNYSYTLWIDRYIFPFQILIFIPGGFYFIKSSFTTYRLSYGILTQQIVALNYFGKNISLKDARAFRRYSMRPLFFRSRECFELYDENGVCLISLPMHLNDFEMIVNWAEKNLTRIS